MTNDIIRELIDALPERYHSIWGYEDLGGAARSSQDRWERIKTIYQTIEKKLIVL